jgi:flagellar basal-body rod protein FlgB
MPAQPARKWKSMLDSVFQKTTIPVLEEVVYFSQARHEVLAGNIANLDTPGYRTKDLSPEVFQERLREAIEVRGAPESAGVRSLAGSDPLREVRQSMKTILRHDENEVGMEQQVMAMTKNQTTHNVAIALMTSQFRLLEAAVTERI